MELQKNKVFVQIGTNNGNDEFNKFVRQYNPSKVILIEPNSKLNQQIELNYNGIEVLIENYAITDTTKKEKVKIVKPKNIYNGRAKNGFYYSDAGYSLIPMDDWGDELDELEVPSISLNDLMKKHNVINIHYLQIDTEGYDSEIIKSIDFTTLNIDILKYENWIFSEDSFKRHGDDKKLYGINGMDNAEKLLKDLGYILTTDNIDTVATKIVKNE
jgi:FkbM family methyltransferase